MALLIAANIGLELGFFGSFFSRGSVKPIVYLSIYSLVAMHFLRIDQINNMEHLQTVVEQVNQKGELDLIIQNLKESLLIISQNKIELVNEQFLN